VRIKLIVFLFLLMVVCLLSIAYLIGVRAPSTKEAANETFAPGTYKTYINGELGFSFKYPKQWFLVETPKGLRGGTLLLDLLNYDPNNEPNIGIEEESDIVISIWQDSGSIPLNIARDKKKRIISHYSEANKYAGSEVYKIKTVDTFKVKGGELFRVRGQCQPYKLPAKEYDSWLLYLHLKNGTAYFRELEQGVSANAIIEISAKLAPQDQDAYRKMLGSIIIH
jgi:hypothetical protein